MHALRNVALALLVFAGFFPPLSVSAAFAQRASFALALNGIDEGEAVIVLRDDDVLVPISFLVGAQLDVTSGRREDVLGTSYVSLHSLAPRITYTVDDGTLTLRLRSDVTSLPPTQVDFRNGRRSDSAATAVPSAFVNYSLSTQAQQAALGFVESGITTRTGLLYSSASLDGSRVHRGLTSFTVGDQSRVTRTTVGDELAETGALGGALLLGGVGISRDYNVAPGFVRTPTAGIAGTAYEPSSADIYVNGSYYRTVEVPPGQFNFKNIPVPQGSSVTKVTLRDAGGNVQHLSTPFYVANEVLRRGLTDYSYHLGFVRDAPFGANDRYGPVAVLGRYRLGLTDALTLGGRFEATRGVVSGGPSVDARLPIGGLNLSAAYSSSNGTVGRGVRAAYAYTDGRFSVGADVAERSATYATTSLRATDDRRTFESSQFVSLPIARIASLTFAHTNVRSRDARPEDEISLNVTVPLARRVTLNVLAQQTRGGSNQASVLGLLTIPLGAASTASVSLERTGGRNVASLGLQKSAPVGTGFGYQLQTGIGSAGTSAGTAIYQSPFGDVRTSFTGNASTNSALLNVSGGVAAFRNGFYFTRPIDGGYALVTVAGPPGVPVYVENQPIGKTNRRGTVLLPNLSPYVDNRVTISELDAPLDYETDRNEQFITPRGRAGVVASFHLNKVQMFTGTLRIRARDADVVPAFGLLNLVRGGKTSVSDIGRNGEFYFENLAPGTYAATALWDHSRCQFALRVSRSEALAVKLGSLVCSAETMATR